MWCVGWVASKGWNKQPWKHQVQVSPISLSHPLRKPLSKQHYRLLIKSYFSITITFSSCTCLGSKKIMHKLHIGFTIYPHGKALFVGSAAPSPSTVTAVTSDSAAAALAHDVTQPYRVWRIVQFAWEHKRFNFLSKIRTCADFLFVVNSFSLFLFIFFFFVTEGFSWQCSDYSHPGLM